MIAVADEFVFAFIVEQKRAVDIVSNEKFAEIAFYCSLGYTPDN